MNIHVNRIFAQTFYTYLLNDSMILDKNERFYTRNQTHFSLCFDKHSHFSFFFHLILFHLNNNNSL